jgi:MFS family permease
VDSAGGFPQPTVCLAFFNNLADGIVQGAVTALANGIGPVIGGALSKSSESWRWIFRLNLPLTALSTIAVIFFVPLKKVKGDWKLGVAKLPWLVCIGAERMSTENYGPSTSPASFWLWREPRP